MTFEAATAIGDPAQQGSLLDAAYELGAAYDEMFDRERAPRPHYRRLFQRLKKLSSDEFRQRKTMSDLSMRRDGVGFTVYRNATGQDGNSLFANPQLTNPGAGDVHLTGGSPAINAGDPAFVPGAGEVDIDGQPRVNGVRVRTVQRSERLKLELDQSQVSRSELTAPSSSETSTS